MISNETSAVAKTQAEKDEPDIELDEVVDTNKLPGVPEIFEEVMSRTIPKERINFLRENFYQDFSDEEILLIERTMIFHFEKFGRIARWVQDRKNQKPFIEEFGASVDSALADRLQAINEMSADGSTSTAFANLDMVEYYLKIYPDDSLKNELLKKAANKDEVRFTDVGCGGQAADIQLLLDQDLIDKKVVGTGISAFDYGENLRAAFPEIIGKIFFNQLNIYVEGLETQSDLVFSVRTLSYTGVIDAVRFLKALHDMATDDGIILSNDVMGESFDFKDSEFDSLEDYLLSLKGKFPSLKFSNERGDYVISWNKSEGFPFEGFVAKKIKYNDSDSPYFIRYAKPSRD
jgi:hypothetical protein